MSSARRTYHAFMRLSKKGTKTIHYHRAFQEQSLTKKSLDSKVNSPNCKKWIQIIQFQGKSRAVNIINNKQ